MSSTTGQLGFVEKPTFQHKDCYALAWEKVKNTIEKMHTSTALLLQAQLAVLADFMAHQGTCTAF